MRSISRRPVVRFVAPPLGGAIGALAGTAVALAGTLTAGAPVRVPDNPLGGGSACSALIASQTALGRVGLPDDIGGAVAALLDEGNRWVNAQRIEVSGGMFL
jgi:NAD(P)-dependent dehydrogenase (short-subunit alcohol dehydrogenase family)